MAERKATMGVYRLYDRTTGESYVGFSRNIESTLKRLRFELTLNACPYTPLQEFWNQRGELVTEILEPYYPKTGLSDEELDGYLRARMYYHMERLKAKAVQVAC